jgi:hypothetical protein
MIDESCVLGLRRDEGGEESVVEVGGFEMIWLVASSRCNTHPL